MAEERPECGGNREGLGGVGGGGVDTGLHSAESIERRREVFLQF
jgi:hypothetical protein